MRILHLIDGSGPQAGATTLAMIADAYGRLGDVEQEVVVLGGTSLRMQAEAVGLKEAEIFGTPFGNGLLGWRRVKRFMASRKAFDVVHTWSLGALALASLCARNTARAMTVTTALGNSDLRWLRALCSDNRLGSTVILPISSTLRRQLLGAGIPQEKVQVLRPGIDLSRVDAGARGALRKSWGVENEGVKVVALLSDPAVAADAAVAGLAVGLAEESQRLNRNGSDAEILKLLVHPDQLNRIRAQRVIRQIERPDRMMHDLRIQTPWEVLSGCDMALAIGPSAGGLSLLWAMASGVAIVGEATTAVGEIVEDRHSAMLVKPGETRLLAHRMLQLQQDGQLAWKLRDTARHEAYAYFSRQTYCENVKGVYTALATGRRVEVAELRR